ncbi:MAG TPA: helix-turn-helix domain-containing protein [Streptosporangiaceae bacterium]|jgi:sugar diacid utilization regulator|nr:helix-turn-helix domain-containing protein [Streptosporangiaceae bacterium]
MARENKPSEPVAAIAAAVETGFDAMVAAAADAIWEQVPAYQASSDPGLRANVAAHVASVFRVFVSVLHRDTPVTRDDFAGTREQAARREAQGISLADFLRAFRIGQQSLWQSVLAASRDDPEQREAALGLVAPIMAVIEIGSTVAAEAYAEAQQHRLAEHDRARRDLLEDLLARQAVTGQQKRSILENAGLRPDSQVLVASAVLTMDRSAAHALTDAADAFAGERGRRGLTVVRQQEIVVVLPLTGAPGSNDGERAAVSAIQRACDDLRAKNLLLSTGVSTAHAGLREVPDAYAEAIVAREALGEQPGVLALPLLSAFDYLVLREGPTAQRLIRPEVARFVTEDAAAGGALIATLAEYAACDLNAKTAAARLHLHVNTAYYRLERIAERTGCDLRNLNDVVELLIAIRLIGGQQSG